MRRLRLLWLRQRTWPYCRILPLLECSHVGAFPGKGQRNFLAGRPRQGLIKGQFFLCVINMCDSCRFLPTFQLNEISLFSFDSETIEERRDILHFQKFAR